MILDLRRRIYVWIGAAGLILCLLFSVTGWANPWEARFVFPSLSIYLAAALAMMVFRPTSLAIIERSGFWAVAVVWLAGMAIALTDITDDERAWESLSPGVFMNMALLVMMAYLWYDTHWALLASLVGPVASTVIGLVRFWGNPEYVGRLLKYEGYVIVIAAFIYLLARGRASNLASQIEAERMRVLAFEDALTGLPNRRNLAGRLNTLLSHAGLTDTLSVISFDLDEFKAVNDVHGHEAGDRLLQDVAVLASEHLPRDAMLGRWGGEEFLVLLPGLDIARAKDVAESLRLALATRDDAGIHVTASFGVIQAADGDTVDDVLRSVDELLYRAKRSGRNTVETASMISRTVSLGRSGSH